MMIRPALLLALGAVLLPSAALAAGDATKGKAIFMRCMACHKVDKSGTSGLGPNLYGVVGRPVGTFKGYAYSPAMKAKGGTWSAKALDTYLSGPAANTVPGTKMMFMGIPTKTDRDDLIAYLATAGN